MKDFFTRLFAPILNYFETGSENYTYQASHRNILIVVGLLFLLLSGGSLYVSLQSGEAGGVIPVLGFFLVGAVCEIVGLLGSDKAIAKIWKNR